MTRGRIPKALLPIGGVPIIFRQMRVLRREGVSRLSVLAGHLGDQLKSALAPEASALGLDLRVIIEPEPLGTAGCLTALQADADEDTLIVYGDMLFDVALAPLADFHRRLDPVLTVLAHPNDHPRTSDLIVEEDGFVKAILPRAQPRDTDFRNLVPAGIYLASPALFAKLAPGVKSDMVTNFIPALLASGVRIAAYNTPEYLRDIGTTSRHEKAAKDLADGRVDRLNRAQRRPAIFLDCDGVLNEEPGQNGALAPGDVRLIAGAADAVRRAREAGRLTIGVTNRPQIAKGFITPEDLSHILGRLEALLALDGGVLDRIYYCPHHPERGFAGEVEALKVRCQCRKPGTLLLERAVADLPVDRARSSLIGDSLRDIGAARNFGIWAYGVRTGAGCRDMDSYRRENGAAPLPDLMFSDVSEAIDFDLAYETIAAPLRLRIAALLGAQPAPLVVGICGRTRAGKSTMAHALVRTLTEEGKVCLHVALDHWIVPLDERGPNDSAESRARVDAIPDVIRRLRERQNVSAPGYEPATRGPGKVVSYDPSQCSVILVEGVFAGHRLIKPMLDLCVFVDVPPALQRTRFDNFYQWKGLQSKEVESLWRERAEEEWPLTDAQRESADLVVSFGEKGQ